MAHFAHQRPAAEIGGKYLKNNPPLDMAANFRPHHSKSPASEETPQTSIGHSGGRGSDASAGDEASNEEEDGDSTGENDDVADEKPDEEEIFAPSRGIGLGKGKRPVIRIEPADNDESEEETSSRGAGHNSTKHPLKQFLKRDKKRTYSNVSNHSVLFGEDDDQTDHLAFPRRKMARRLSSNDTKGLLTYQKSTGMGASEPAFEISDDEGTEKTLDVDDEDYSGVNLIPEESDVEQLEEQEEEWLINEVQHSADLFSDARRLSLDSSASDNLFGTDLSMAKAFYTVDQYPDAGFSQFFETDLAPTSPEPNVERKFSDASTKRVRFDDEVNMSDSSSTSSSELDSSLWPDLFEKDKLPPNLYRMIENDHDLENGGYSSTGSEHSYWDFGQEDNAALLGNASDDFDDESSDAGSSGYETDLGDTTDEYDSDFGSPPPKAPESKSVLRRPSSAPGSRAATPKPYQRSNRPTPKGKFIPPVCGVFIHGDRNEAIAVTNKTTKTVNFFRPRTTAIAFGAFGGSSTSSTAQSSPRTALQHLSADDSDLNDALVNSLPNAADIMFTGIFGAAPNSDFGDMFGTTAVGRPEAFFPFVSVSQNGTMRIMTDEDEFFDDDDDDADFGEDVNIEEFMNFGPDGDETDVEQDEATDVPATPATSMIAMPSSTPAQANDATPTNRKRNTSDAMLQHFDRGVVTAFRNNQNHYRSLARLPHDPDLRASFTRPLRSGRTAETLMSPLRKRSISKRMKEANFTGISKATARLTPGIGGSRAPPMGTFT